ncbi:hypothetical protein VNO78_18610 [Psophocarpus tetragonolobus]|uniref:Uncharacterized protein n=1 Tax=Psophocarpus tetragonolobus TaxID=3891 RepID=A0AAN9XM73_PSOTE
MRMFLVSTLTGVWVVAFISQLNIVLHSNSNTIIITMGFSLFSNAGCYYCTRTVHVLHVRLRYSCLLRKSENSSSW